MPQSPLRLIRRYTELRSIDEVDDFPRELRGIYVLYQRRRRAGNVHYNVVYVGMAAAGRRGGIKGRLRKHRQKKPDLWTHFSAFQVWDNIRDEEIRELEGLFRHIYKTDAQANRLNVARGFKLLKSVRNDRLTEWRGK